MDDLLKKCLPLFDQANKRIDRLQKSGLQSPALDTVMEKGKFSAKGKDLNELEQEYKRVQAFLNMTTSTVSGAMNFERELEQLMKRVDIEVDRLEKELGKSSEEK